jgi:hypothetical protein
VEFKAGTSLLSVCAHCSSAVARVGDDITELEILGQVAPLADIGSPLRLGTRGHYKGEDFQLIGRVQLDYGRGPWNEWYASFDRGSWGWIAEAQGRVYFTFGKSIPDLPDYARAGVGSAVHVGQLRFVIVERRKAHFSAAEGEIPFRATPGANVYYADCEGPNGAFGTIDYGSEGKAAEMFFVGDEVSYEALFDKSVLADITPGRAAAAVGLNCPNCGAPVPLRAPDDAQRVTCAACDSLLDCSKGNELFLLSSEKGKGPGPAIPLGAAGLIDGVKWTVFGFLVRSTVVDSIKYFWEEYLLHADGRGYAWLVSSDHHLSFVRPIHAGDVHESGATVRYRDRTFRLFQAGSAKVERLSGEFYWKVELGETTGVSDYVDPPSIISEEMASGEVSWSSGEYVPVEQIEKAFKLERRLPRPHGVAPNQPNPHTASFHSSFKLGALFTALLVVSAMIIAARSPNREVFSKTEVIKRPSPPLSTETGTGETILSEPFEINRLGNLEINLRSPVSDRWLFVMGTLINQTTNEARDFGVGVSYYSGVDDGESWSEGSTSRTIYLGEVRPGTYVVKLTPEWGPANAPPSAYTVSIHAGVFLPSHVFAALLLIWLVPIFLAMAHWSFEKRRWAESST